MFPLSEAEIQDLLSPAQVSVGYVCVLLVSPGTIEHTTNVFINYVLNCEQMLFLIVHILIWVILYSD